MKKMIATALIACSAQSGFTAAANADYFGTSKQAQEGQHSLGFVGQVEKSGV